VVEIPPKDIEILGWRHGEELKGSPIREGEYFISTK